MKDIKIESLSNESKITFQATLGLVALRSGEIELGKNLYEKAVQSANIRRLDHLEKLAVVNFTNVLIDLNLYQKSKYIEIVKNMKVPADQQDLQVLRKDVLLKIQRQFK